MAAFRLAVAREPAGFECDVSRTADNEIVCIHDATTTRTTGTNLTVAASTLAELKALDAQHARLQRLALALNTERVTLALASYQAGRGDLGTVLAARREAVETRLRLIDLDAQRAALRVRLNSLIAE